MFEKIRLFFEEQCINQKILMLEINPIKNKINDLKNRSDVLRGYL